MNLLQATTIIALINIALCRKFSIIDYLPAQWRDAFKDIVVNPDFGLDIYQFLRKYDYPIETHWIITEDNYVLRMHRIPAGQNKTNLKGANKPAVLLMHGLSSTAMQWVNMGPKKGLALALADAGYDVWLGNNRGNTWSRMHVGLDPDIDKEFWDFSFERCGQYDLPAKIDYILENTGQQKIFYVGHSQGTSQFFAMAALRPEYNDKIALMTALAPVAYMEHMSSPLLKLLAKYLDPLTKVVEALHITEFSKFNPVSQEINKFFCSDGSPTLEICAFLLFASSGYDSGQLNRSVISVHNSNTPGGSSINMQIHYGQEIQSGHFRRFDYGSVKNLELYKSEVPPDFDLNAISVPVALYYGQNDFMAAVKDVERLANELPNVVKKRLIEYKRWNHLDFNIANDVYTIINKDLIDHQQQFIDNGALTTTTTERPNGSEKNNIVSKYLITIVISILFTMNY